MSSTGRNTLAFEHNKWLKMSPSQFSPVQQYLYILQKSYDVWLTSLSTSSTSGRSLETGHHITQWSPILKTCTHKGENRQSLCRRRTDVKTALKIRVTAVSLLLDIVEVKQDIHLCMGQKLYDRI